MILVTVVCSLAMVDPSSYVVSRAWEGFFLLSFSQLLSISFKPRNLYPGETLIAGVNLFNMGNSCFVSGIVEFYSDNLLGNKVPATN